jgi:hypothetical protein
VIESMSSCLFKINSSLVKRLVDAATP